MNIIKPMNLLLPSKTVDLYRWSIIACDQFSNNEKFWDKVFNTVINSPSSYFVTLPEVYLREDNSNIISMINEKMKEYLSTGVLRDIGSCFVLVDRKTKYSNSRRGLVMCVDLEQFSFIPEDKSLIRSGEKIVMDKIPPRLQIRSNAEIEMSHVMLFFDDRKENIIEKLYQNKDSMEVLYDTDLNMDGGHVTGYKVTDTASVIESFNKLLDPEYLKETFGTDDKILFAVGDGNHSLATAKAHWLRVKQKLTPEQRENHPARYALVEAININDKGLSIHPIHRVVYNADEKLVNGLTSLYTGEGNRTTLIFNGNKYVVNLPSSTPDAVRLVQDYIDQYLENNPKAKGDYIHGFQNLLETCRLRPNSVGVLMPKMEKEDIFPYILNKGLLPKKTFSTGEAEEKRYYMEAKKLK